MEEGQKIEFEKTDAEVTKSLQFNTKSFLVVFVNQYDYVFLWQGYEFADIFYATSILHEFGSINNIEQPLQNLLIFLYVLCAPAEEIFCRQ